ncbi:MAG: family 10 glycosylhydrolase [Bacteroidales bacterium]|nr:family 10 glycosylhydrolase [Bacteroidales bacterium]
MGKESKKPFQAEEKRVSCNFISKKILIPLILSLLCYTNSYPNNDSTRSSGIAKSSGAAQEDPVKGVWLTNVCSDALDSRANIIKAVEFCREVGINHIFVVTWNRAATTYPSRVAAAVTGSEIEQRFAGRDPLKELIEESHKKGIKVHAWFEFGFSCSYKEEDGGVIIRNNPHWASKDIDGKLVSKNDFQWMNPFHPQVQDFMIALIKEVVTNYNIDGIQGDDRLPALPSTGGYDPYTTELYKREHNNNPPPSNYRDTSWVNWRADKLTEFLGRLYRETKEIKPNIIVSMAPSIHPWAKEEYLQDWPEWLRRGYCDLIIPQVYRHTIEAYKTTLNEQLKYLRPQERELFYPGVLIQVEDNVIPSNQMFEEIIRFNREKGFKGETLFYYEGLKHFKEILIKHKNH